MEVVLEDNGLKEFIYHDIPKPTASDAKDLSEWRKCVEKARRIILEGVQNHIVLTLHGNDTPYSMWKAFMTCFRIVVTIGSWH